MPFQQKTKTLRKYFAVPNGSSFLKFGVWEETRENSLGFSLMFQVWKSDVILFC